MLKFVFASASLVTSAYAAGVIDYSWPANIARGGVITPLAVLDPIGTNNNQIDMDTDIGTLGTTSYVGLIGSADTLSSHEEQATGGPITKTECVSPWTDCLLNLYQNLDTFNPVPAGIYHAIAVDGSNANYGTARSADHIVVTINPYISAWGSTLTQTANPNIERGDDLLITWDGLSLGDVIEYRLTAVAAVNDCPPDFHVITQAEEDLGRGTIALKTARTETLVGFAEVGVHTISLVDALDAKVYGSVSLAQCDILSNLDGFAPAEPTGNTARAVRGFTVTESDAIAVNGENGDGITGGIEAGVDLTVTYTLATATTAGTYVGLWLVGDAPLLHAVGAVGAGTGSPVSVSVLPVGISGSGSIQLNVPITAVGNYIVNIYNSNDAPATDRGFTPLAETSIGAFGFHGPHDTSAAVVHNTDVTVISAPTGEPSGQPSDEPTGQPSGVPTSPTGQPTGIPTSSPSYVEEPWGEWVWTEKRHRKAGMCENQCSGHGTCEVNGNCKCFTGLDGEDEWTGPDCSSRTCPFDFAWVGSSINSNNLHPWAECSNKGICDRGSGECQCFTGYEGAACQRTVCPDNCNDQGTCWPEKHLASKAGRVYEAPWDAMKHVGCLCDAGYRGPACDQQECPSGADPLSGYGNEAGRDCSGRGICDYSNGICACFTGFFGTRCQHQTTVM